MQEVKKEKPADLRKETLAVQYAGEERAQELLKFAVHHFHPAPGSALEQSYCVLQIWWAVFQGEPAPPCAPLLRLLF